MEDSNGVGPRLQDEKSPLEVLEESLAKQLEQGDSKIGVTRSTHRAKTNKQIKAEKAARKINRAKSRHHKTAKEKKARK